LQNARKVWGITNILDIKSMLEFEIQALLPYYNDNQAAPGKE
jgi:hypothetical protein